MIVVYTMYSTYTNPHTLTQSCRHRHEDHTETSLFQPSSSSVVRKPEDQKHHDFKVGGEAIGKPGGWASVIMTAMFCRLVFGLGSNMSPWGEGHQQFCVLSLVFFHTLWFLLVWVCKVLWHAEELQDFDGQKQDGHYFLTFHWFLSYKNIPEQQVKNHYHCIVNVLVLGFQTCI